MRRAGCAVVAASAVLAALTLGAFREEMQHVARPYLAVVGGVLAALFAPAVAAFATTGKLRAALGLYGTDLLGSSALLAHSILRL